MGASADNTIVMIPSYNEARTIGSIVRSLVRTGLDVLVIDDGSADNTERQALDNGAMVIRHKTNLGKGVSVRSGLQHILDKMNYEWIVMMDGDGQHHPEDVPVLMGATTDKETDIVIGNRMGQTSNMPSARYLTNKFTSWVLSKMCGQAIPDTQCGFRLLRADALRGLQLESDKYDIESEMIIQAASNGLKISSATVQTIYGDEYSRINPLRDTIKFFQLIIKHSAGRHALRRRSEAHGRNTADAEGHKRR